MGMPSWSPSDAGTPAQGHTVYVVVELKGTWLWTTSLTLQTYSTEPIWGAFSLGQTWDLYRASWGVAKESGMCVVTLKGTMGFECAGGFLGSCKTKMRGLTLQVQLQPKVSRAPSLSPHSVIGSSILKYLRSRGLQ